MHTVDSAQGREYDFVILDLVTPGGRLYPLGFVADTKRMCVALSRARDRIRTEETTRAERSSWSSPPSCKEFRDQNALTPLEVQNSTLMRQPFG